MTDKELLELAAKACGKEVIGFQGCSESFFLKIKNEQASFGYNCWNPLLDKSDCMEMEIDLRLAVQPVFNQWVIYSIQPLRITEIARHQDRQRASTMAAAEIGKMK